MWCMHACELYADIYIKHAYSICIIYNDTGNTKVSFQKFYDNKPEWNLEHNANIVCIAKYLRLSYMVAIATW